MSSTNTHFGCHWELRDHLLTLMSFRGTQIEDILGSSVVFDKSSHCMDETFWKHFLLCSREESKSNRLGIT